jgi:uncharacterized membrane protein YheB (UPF0754 family)
MGWVQYISSIAVSSLCGWAIAWVAIKLLFHPQKPIKIWGITIQGALANKQQNIIKQLAKWISKTFVPFNEIEEKILDPDNFQQLRPEVEKHIDNFLRNKLKDTFPMFSAFVGDKTINQLKEAFLKEVEILFPILIKNYITTLQQNIDIETIIETKLASISSKKIENIFSLHIKKRMLVFGACVGFLVGNIQILFIHLIQ